MRVKYHRDFVKSFKKRVSRDKKLKKRFEQRMERLLKNVDDPVLRNHRLTGDKREYRSFSVTGDVRVIYRRMEDEIWLYDIGTHNQVY